MPHASHRLDLLVVPINPHEPLDEGVTARLFDEWGLDGGGRCENMERFIEGGCNRIWMDRPGRLWLYGNQLGGFRVRCPDTNTLISSEFGRAHRAWKAGAERVLACPCGSDHGLDACIFSPPAAFATWAVVFSDIGGTALTPLGESSLHAAVGPYRVLTRRP